MQCFVVMNYKEIHWQKAVMSSDVLKLRTILLGLLLIIPSIYSAPLSSYLVSSFTSPDPILPFNHITINNITGDVYIGARERLYQLNSDLTLKHTVDTGSCLNRYINNNKLLIVAPSPENKLITCGGCDGFCETRSLTNVSHNVVRHDYLTYQLVVTTEDAPTVGAVVLGADFVWDGEGTSNAGLYLFTGVSFATIPNPSVSKHSLVDLGRVQSAQEKDPSSRTDFFQHVIAYLEYLYYFIARENTVYLGRLCSNSLDVKFASYTEIELECESHNEIQTAHIRPAGSQLADSFIISSADDLLYAVFTSGSSSALCTYRMSDVLQRFEDAVLGCIQGDSSKGTTNDLLGGSTCNSFTFTPPDSAQCTAYYDEDGEIGFYYRYASGVNPLSASPIITIPDVMATSIVTAIERQHTVAFIGDRQGFIHKLNIVNSSFGYVYETVTLGSGTVLQEMFLNESTEQLTLATSSDQGSKVLTLELVNCGQYQTCDECIGGNGGSDGDPYCGWCTLEARCTRYAACPLSDESTRWLSYNSLQCVSISKVQPDSLPLHQTEQEIIITVQQLPDLRDSFQYMCVFDSYEVVATTTGNTLTCTSPPENRIPTIPDGSDHVTLKLSIMSTETDLSFVNTDFDIFDCATIASCSSCVTSPYPCDWCVYDNKCTDDSTSCQSGDTVVIGENNPVGSGNQGQEFCPQLLGTTDAFFIPVNIPLGFSLLAKNLPTDQSEGPLAYECILHIEGEEVRVSSPFFNETYILCNDDQYLYNENILQKNVSVSVQWNGQNDVDDLSGSYVTLYKCSVNSGSCSQCLSQEATPPILNCGWCGNDCNVIQSDVCQNNHFLRQNETQFCSAPVITDFFPMSGPVNGHTRLEIKGTDIGVEYDDVQQILIQDLECDLTDMGMYYQPGQTVSCMTGIAMDPISGRIKITVMSGTGNKTGETSEEFHYRDPVVTGFDPREGPVAGGTAVTISGIYLDTGRNIMARFGEAECVEISVGETVATCVTSSIPQNQEIPVPLTMTFDGVERTFTDYTFTYMPNPRIEDIDRTETIMAGGTDITLTGERFDLIQEPRIVVSSLTSYASNSELCNGTSTLLICPTPSFPDDAISVRRRRAVDGAMEANLTFDFDGYIIDGGIIEYFPNPVYNDFSGDNRIYKSGNRRLEIAGMNLNLASTEDDVQVLLGPDGVCNVDDLEVDVLRCELPDKEPKAGNINGTLDPGPVKNLPAVTVVHGNLRFYPGFVSAWAASDNQLSTIIIVVIVLFVVLIIPMILVAWWFRKKQRHLQQAREEVEMVRSNILNRVREVANTSLNVSEADDRVQKQGVPFRGHVHYVTMMLFNGLDVHPETSDPEYMEDFMEQSVISFYRMLKKKEVLLDFIRQLESKKQGHGREQELIASLLAITFVSEGKSIHFTDVLMSLVEDQIRRASISSRGLDTLFTKTETIAEKLISNWFALFMFTYLKVYALYPMYMLYQAIKTQAEKGPVDATTDEAYYTLEYSRLFDQTIEFHCLGLDVADEDGQIYLQVNVLDVDSVKQAKQKVLDSVWRKGYCLLPRDVDAVDLVWIQTHERSVLLQDTEGSAEAQGKIMINTMKSYGIHNGSRVALIPKQHGKCDGYQALALEDISSNMYESLVVVTAVDVPEPDAVDVPEPDMSQQDLKAIHLKDIGQPTMKGSTIPDHIQQKKAKIDRNLAIPHMLTMKAAISPYVDGFFEVMFKMPAKIPLPVKHLFDTFDELAVKYAGGGRPEACAENWKKNCLSNFWRSLLTTVPSLFEMPRSETADRCMLVLADALNHATKTISLRQEESDHLPYYKEHPLQRRMVTDCCNEITNRPKVRQIKMNRACSSISKEFKGQFSHLSNMLHLYNLTKNDVDNLLK